MIAASVPTAGLLTVVTFSHSSHLLSAVSKREASSHIVIWEDIVMHFCLTAQYTPQALNHLMDNPTANRYEAAKKLIEAAGGKLISMYSMPADGPGVLTIFDVPDPAAAPAISGVLVASGAIHHVQLKRLLTQEEVINVRQKAKQLRDVYKAPGA